MKIAVTLVGIRDTNFSSVGRFIWKWLEGEIHAHPEHQFLLLSDIAQPTSFVGAPNCSWIKTKYDRTSFRPIVVLGLYAHHVNESVRLHHISEQVSELQE